MKDAWRKNKLNKNGLACLIGISDIDFEQYLLWSITGHLKNERGFEDRELIVGQNDWSEPVIIDVKFLQSHFQTFSKRDTNLLVKILDILEGEG